MLDAVRGGGGVKRSNSEAELKSPEEALANPVSPVTVHNHPSSEITQPGANRAIASTPQRSGLYRGLLWTVTLALTAGVSATLGAALMLFGPFNVSRAAETAPPVRSINTLLSSTFGYRVTRPVNILVLGIDRVLEPENDDIFSGRSDTMLLVHVDPIKQAVNVLSIPRDTQVEIPGYGVFKVNQANAEGGALLAAQTVNQNFGDVQIDRYVRVSTDAFRELVDLLGGVEVYVPQPMKYQDNTQKLTIDLEQGWQTLNGEQAEQFARFRKDAFGDIGRVQRQQQLIRALKDRLINPTIVTKVPQIIELMQSYIDTNLTFEEMVALANLGIGLEKDNFRMVMLPGRFSTPSESLVSYWIMDPDGRDRVMQDYFQADGITEVSEPRRTSRLRIAVQNATDDPRLAREVAVYLQNHGFDNVYVIRDWSDAQDETQIIVQRGDLQGAALLESTLGLGEIVPASIGDLESDLTIRVGSDWLTRADG